MSSNAPPSAPDIEQAYLGLLLSDQKAANESVALLPLGNLYVPKHEIIYEAICDLVNSGEPVDIITVSERLKSIGEIDKIGGIYYLTELKSKAELRSNQEYYSHILVEYAMRRKGHIVLIEKARKLYDPRFDVFEVLDDTQRDLFEIEQGVGRGGNIIGMDSAIHSAYLHLKEVDGAEGGITGVGTGFTGLDAITGGWQKNDLIIIAARPSMGKTALGLSMIRNSWKLYGIASGYFSFEMSSRPLGQRLLTAEARVDATKARTGRLTEQDWNQIEIARERLQGINIFLDDSVDASLSYVMSRARRMVSEGAGAIYVDYMQLMNNKADTREQEISSISRGLKKLAMELDVPVIALSQLSRAVESRGGDKRPQLSDLRESGAIEQDADIVAFVYRAERYGIEVDSAGNSTQGIGEVIIGKHRSGALGVVPLAFLEQYARFENLTTSYVPDEYNFEDDPDIVQTEFSFD